MNSSCLCRLFLSPDQPAAHPPGQTCVWALFSGPCPDCHQERTACSFFSEAGQVNACRNLSRLVELGLLLNKRNVQRPATASRKVFDAVKDLCGSDPDFAVACHEAYRSGIVHRGEANMPASLPEPYTFVVDRSSAPWRFIASTAAESMTIQQFARRLDIVPVAAPGEAQEGDAPLGLSPQDMADMRRALAAFSSLSQRLESLERAVAGGRDVEQAETLLRQVNQQPVRQSAAAVPPVLRAASPTSVFNLADNSVAVGNSVSFGGHPAGTGPRPELGKFAQSLLARNIDPEMVAQILQECAPSGQQADHVQAWRRVTAGTSPLCVYSEMDPKLRDTLPPTTIAVETWDRVTQKSIRLKVPLWPRCAPGQVEPFMMTRLGEEWTKSLAYANERLKQITPAVDLARVPVLPLQTAAFLQQLPSYLSIYSMASVLEAWEAVHSFFVEEYVNRSSAPTWDQALARPEFVSRLLPKTLVSVSSQNQKAQGSAAATGGDSYCRNWNFQEHKKCNPKPDPTCDKLHRCMRCGGAHPFAQCSQKSLE